MGVDKLNYSKGTFRFSDISLFSYGGIYKNENFDRVNFYTFHEKSAIDIIRKQAHILYQVDKIGNKKAVDCFNKTWETDYENVIYNLKNPILYESPKSPLSSISLRDMFMLRTNETDMHKFFKEGLKMLNDITSIRVRPVYYTKSYKLEKS